jgi:hypothetical protein
MGRPQLNQFSVLVAVDENNEPVGLCYFDQEGCGHESKSFPLDRPLSDLMSYHDRHRSDYHDLHREQRCKFEAVPGEASTRCQREVHDLKRDPQHRVELTW